MFYKTLQNPQQKSLGLFVVISLHAALFWAFAQGLGIDKGIDFPDPVIMQVIEEKIIAQPLPSPVEPQLQQNNFAANITPPPVIAMEKTTESSGIIQPPILVQPTVSMTKPSILSATKPLYPTASLHLGEEGATGLRLYITEKGRVAEVKLMSSSGSTRLDEAAIKHAQHNWRFNPCVENGQAVACWFNTKLVWKIAEARKK